MYDAVAIAVKRPSVGMRRLRVLAAGRVGTVHRVGGKQRRFAGHDQVVDRRQCLRLTMVRLPPRLAREAVSEPFHRTSNSQAASSDWGITSTPPMTGMKFVSPLQRGTMCQCRWPGTPAPATWPRFKPTLKPCSIHRAFDNSHDRGNHCRYLGLRLDRQLVESSQMCLQAQRVRGHCCTGNGSESPWRAGRETRPGSPGRLCRPQTGT